VVSTVHKICGDQVGVYGVGGECGTCEGGKKCLHGFGGETWVDPGIDVMIILKWIVKKRDRMAWGWSHLNQDRDVTGRREHGITKLYGSGNFFTVRGTVTSRRGSLYPEAGYGTRNFRSSV
jgi:hypothetical protein